MRIYLIRFATDWILWLFGYSTCYCVGRVRGRT